MVVLDDIRGLEVTVQVNGTAAKEYDNPDRNEIPELTHDDFHLAVRGQALPHVVKYIEAKPGERFEVHVQRTPHFQRIGVNLFYRVEVDGCSDNMCWSDHSSSATENWTNTVSYLLSIMETGTERHHFKFANLDVGEVENLKQAELKNQTEKTKKWGKIVVRVYHAAGQEQQEWAISKVATNKGHGRISEKAVKGKALDAVTEFDSTPSSRPKIEYRSLYSDPQKRPFAMFEFRYRTKRGLVREGIIPRTPSPTLEDEIHDMPDDEVRRLARELLARERKKSETPAVKEENRRGIKREIDLTDEDPFAADVPPYKTQRRADGALEIDLTDLD
ncbi:hypothetical protein QBC37DRAFT_104955 [Rhypophila decipiens]|uniref:DUF7918 domain-containing protein n=1 Tax=Rhypophila decipiens TaxID=261697 RepID=A0AAN6XU87_9PEZI|nr:hypothetical protein QBC37DRAFT_104955 [Rhypophila decipiens]